MNPFALFLAAGFGIIAGLWLEDVGISVVASIIIAVPVAYGWYQIIATQEKK